MLSFYRRFESHTRLDSDDDLSMHLTRHHRRRYNKAAIAAGILFFLVAGFYIVGGSFTGAPDGPLPPLYSRYHQQELALPQHDLDLPAPEGRQGSYLWLPNHVHSLGWGNAMQELFLNAHLSQQSGRTFVFDNYTWDRDGSDYSRFKNKMIPSRIPLSAIISGPLVGGNFPEGDPTPRAVAKDFWDKVCPHSTIIPKDVVPQLSTADASATLTTQRWVDKFASLYDSCIEVDRNAEPIFDYRLFGSPERLLDIWPSLSKSPFVTHFRWSPLIHAAFDANAALISPVAVREPPLAPYRSANTTSAALTPPYTPLPGLLAMHVRRGDFDGHCLYLAKHSAPFNAFNSFPSISDTFTVPPASTRSADKKRIFMERCLPTIEQMKAKIATVRASEEGRGLKHLYIMTNGDRKWVAGFKAALEGMGGWESIWSSRDLTLNWEQGYVAQGVDMLIGQRAQVFIGNGFSSLSSNIVMLRMANDFPPDSNRFW